MQTTTSSIFLGYQSECPFCVLLATGLLFLNTRRFLLSQRARQCAVRVSFYPYGYPKRDASPQLTFLRSSVLHNPHLGLSNILEKLYNLAKNAADCVVPQEYGTTWEEKRSVGVKISKALLEKIK